MAIRSFPFVALLLVLMTTAPDAWSADRPTGFHSANVDLPFGDRVFPDGPGADAINGNCLTCHSAGMVLTQPPQSRETWRRLVEKMRHSYKAPIGDADVKPIVDYLARIKGTDSAQR